MSARLNALCCVLLPATLLAVAAGCNPGPESSDSDKNRALRLFVSIPPQQWLVEQIAGDRADVEAMLTAGQSPHHFEPSLRQVTRLEQADAYFTIGVTFENAFVPKLARSGTVRVIAMSPPESGTAPDHAHPAHEGEPAEAVPVATRASPHASTVPDETAHAHSHSDAHDCGLCAGSAEDPHVWLSPRRLRAQAQRVADALVQLDPEHKDDYVSRLERVMADLEALDAELRGKLAPCRGSSFLVYHPAFGHFAAAYDLNQLSIEFEGKEPSLKRVNETVERARNAGVRAILTQPQYSRRSAETIARELNVGVVEVDPLAKDVPATLRKLADAVRASITGAPEPQ